MLSISKSFTQTDPDYNISLICIAQINISTLKYANEMPYFIKSTAIVYIIILSSI